MYSCAVPRDSSPNSSPSPGTSGFPTSHSTTRPSRCDAAGFPNEETEHMKRAPLFVLAGTAAGLAGVLSFHTRPLTSAALASPASPAALSTHGQGSGGQGSGGQRKGPAARKRSAGPASVPTAPAGVRSVVGATEQYGYGQLAVKVSVRGGRITDVTVPVIQVAEQYSQQLAGQAFPVLRSEVLSAQTARINGVSGATYTSEAYAASLQAALDKLHIK